MYWPMIVWLRRQHQLAPKVLLHQPPETWMQPQHPRTSPQYHRQRLRMSMAKSCTPSEEKGQSGFIRTLMVAAMINYPNRLLLFRNFKHLVHQTIFNGLLCIQIEIAFGILFDDIHRLASVLCHDVIQKSPQS